jgi:hypothetical protein
VVRQNLANTLQVFHLGKRQNPHSPTTFGPLRLMCCSYCPNLGAGIATRYVLNASGFELLEEIDFFSTPLQNNPGTHSGEKGYGVLCRG